MNLDELPYDILLDILARLTWQDLIRLGQCNKKLYSITNDNLLWMLKLNRDLNKWSIISSRTWPANVELNKYDATINYKEIYLKSNPDITIKKEILKKLNTFLHTTSTSDDPTQQNVTLSSLSSFALPVAIFDQLRDFVYRNVFNQPVNSTLNERVNLNKVVMFGPGLETSTSCIVTNLLWKSEFKTIGMIPGKDGYGSGIKLKLFNHKPFNLTILYTNVSTVREANLTRELNSNKLLTTNNQLNPQVKEACLDANAFIYVLDNKSDLVNSNRVNYMNELSILMNETRADVPVLILALSTDTVSESVSMPCAHMVRVLELDKLKQEWQLRKCHIFEPKMKTITHGFEWILNQLDQLIQ